MQDSYTLFVPSAPSASPQSVTAFVLTTSSVTVAWEEVPATQLNGILATYEVRFQPTGQMGGATVLQNSTEQNTIVTGLNGNVNYSVSVRAYTAVGPGPYSDPAVPITTQPGSKCHLKRTFPSSQPSPALFLQSPL